MAEGVAWWSAGSSLGRGGGNALSPIPGWRLHMIKSVVVVRTSDPELYTSEVGNAPGWCLDMVVEDEGREYRNACAD